MEAQTLVLILAGLAAALGAAGWLSHRLRLPPALGYLAVGAALSPAIEQTPTIPHDLLRPAADVAVLFLLFLIGLELDFKRLREVLRKGAVTLPLDILVPALLVTAVARIAGWGTFEAVALGLALSLSSTLFGERLTGTARFPIGARQRTLGVLLAEDIGAVALLALLAILGNKTAGAAGWLEPLKAIGLLLFLFVLLTAAALIVVPRVLDAVARTHAHELVVLIGAGAVLAFGYLGTVAGSAELGALVAGVAAAEAGARFVVRNGLQSVRDISLAVFFFTSGLGTDLGQTVQHPILVLGLAGLFLFSKLSVHVPAALGSGLSLDDALRSALALGTVGEFSLILAGEAARVGIAHPLLNVAVVGPMLVLLVTVPFLMRFAPAWVRGLNRLPERYRRPLSLALRGLRQPGPKGAPKPALRSPVRTLLSNLILLAALVLLGVTMSPTILGRLPPGSVLAPALVVGLGAALAAPLVWGIYRSYRVIVHSLVGLRAGERDGAAKVRARLVDAWVALTLALLLVPLTLLAPGTLPVLLGGLAIAFVVATLAWRQLGRFHRTLESTVTRVLGQDPEAAAILDRVMERYPWGVRFAAVAVPAGSPLVGQTFAQARLSELTGATIAVLQRRGHETVNPSHDEVVHAGDTLVLMGDVNQLERSEALVVSHGEALRLTAQSRLAAIVELDVHTGSALVGSTLGAADIRGRTGSLVVGVWKRGATHPAPFRTDLPLSEGDRVIVLGAPLQVERARLLAEGVEYEATVDAREAEPRDGEPA